MTDVVEQAKASYDRYRIAFNTRDVEGMVAEMHFPHRRLPGGNEFEVWATADDYRAPTSHIRRCCPLCRGTRAGPDSGCPS